MYAMGAYETLSAIPFARKSYTRKFLLIAFIGIHVPVIGITGYMLSVSNMKGGNAIIFIVALVCTLVSTALSLPFLNNLLKPLLDAKAALAAVSDGDARAPLPTKYEDEVGSLLNQIQTTLNDKDQSIADRDSLFDIISHDFRSPIGRIIGLCNVYDLCDDEERRQHIQIIQHEATALQRDMTQMLKSLKTSAKDGNNSIINLSEIASAAVASLQPMAAEKEITIFEDTQKPFIVRADPFLIGQAVKNVVTNAIKYSGSGRSVYIRVTGDGTMVKLFVTDEGIGFDPADSSRITERFTTMTRTGTIGEATNGLGLSIVKRIAERCSGSLTAYSEGIGKGATFTLTLPAVT